MHLVAIGGSDAGISAALRARELDPSVDVTVVVADAYPNFSICGIPYYFSGEVQPWQSLAHRTHADLEATGMQPAARHLRDRHRRRRAAAHRPRPRTASSRPIDYDELMVGTGALALHRRHRRPRRARPRGRRARAALDGRHLRARPVPRRAADPKTAIIVGAGYVGLEMAEALTVRGLKVTQLQRGPEVLSTLDPELGALVHAELDRPRRRRRHRHHRRARSADRRPASPSRGIHDGEPFDPHRRPRPRRRRRAPEHRPARPRRRATRRRPARSSSTSTMRTGLPHVFAAGDGVITHHRLLGITYLPLGTTAHKQGRVAGENALGGDRPVRRQPRHPGREGLRPRRRPHRAPRARSHRRRLRAASARPRSRTTTRRTTRARSRSASASPATPTTGRLLGAQLVGARGTETAKRVDTYATALFHGMTVDAGQRPRPLLHAAARLPVGRRAGRHPGVEPMLKVLNGSEAARPAPTTRRPHMRSA